MAENSPDKLSGAAGGDESRETHSRKLLQRAIEAERMLGGDQIILRRVQTTNDHPALEPSPTEIRIEIVPEPQRYESLDQHAAAICQCQRCPLGATRNKFVYGVGNPRARILFIGEGPGADEDRVGEPFVGRAGQLLDKILAAIELNREIVYIANVVKCRPPGNRVPTPDEMATCRPYLDEQIRLIGPDLICCLGRTAATAMLPQTKESALGKIRGQWHRVMGIPALVTYHPAALLRDPKYKRDCWEDMKLLKSRYDELPERSV